MRTPATGNSDAAPSFDALTNGAHWRRGFLFCINDALALIPTAEDVDNPLFRGLLGDELQSHVPHAIDLIQGILLSIASHDWKRPDQIPSIADLSSLPDMFHFLPHHQELLELLGSKFPRNSFRSRARNLAGTGRPTETSI
jgi:hypothetical protein